jgi:hypothetical protein
MTRGRFIDRLAAGPHFPRQQGGRFTALGVLAVAVLVASCSGTETGSANVKITGGLEAHFRTSQATCKPAPGSQPGLLADFSLDLGGLHYELRFLTDHDGPGLYTVSDDATFVALNGQGPGWSTLTDDAGRLVVNSDGRSGTLDAKLSPEPSTDNQAIHVIGSWQCPPA